MTSPADAYNLINIFEEPLAGALLAILAVFITWFFRWIIKKTETNATVSESRRKDLTYAEIEFRRDLIEALNECKKLNKELLQRIDELERQVNHIHVMHNEQDHNRRSEDIREDN